MSLGHITREHLTNARAVLDKDKDEVASDDEIRELNEEVERVRAAALDKDAGK